MSLSFANAAKAKKLKAFFQQHGRIYIVVDATSDEVVVPGFLKGDPALRLVLNIRMPQVIHIRDDALESDFSFSGQICTCRIPMRQIWAAYLPEGDMEQGMIWEEGYKNGDFKGHVYADAVACLKAWQQQSIRLYVYSSGSVYAQKLLFGYSDFGDMTPLFAGYFDTTTGAKGDVESYRKITAAINFPAQEILFLSDIDKELDAARAAGMKTVWLVRQGAINTRAVHPQVNSFNDINVAAM